MKKFIISADVLTRALHKLSNALNTKTVLPALSNLYCKVTDKSIEMICSDLETTIHYTCACETGGENFELLIPFQQLSQIVSLNRGCPLTFSLESKVLRISGENDVYDLKTRDKIETFPALVSLPSENTMTLDARFYGWLKTALQTVGKDDKRPALTKVLLELRQQAITIASSDGSFHVFSYTMDLPAPSDDDILISPKVIKTVEGLEDIQLYWNEKNYAFKADNVTVVVTRPDIKFVDFRKIFPTDFDSNLTINKHDLIVALEKCNINTDFFKETILTLNKKGKINLVSKDADFGIKINVDVAGTYTGSVDSIKLNSEKMLKLLQQVEFDEVELAIHNSTRPVLFRAPEDKAYLGLLMTMHQKS